MGVQFNIKNDEAYALARDIAERTGTSLTQAVLDSLRLRQRELTREVRFERVMAIARETAALLGPTPIDHGELLYDENGLPK